MSRLLLCGVLTAAFVLGATAAAHADDACWQLVYGAIEREAAAPHAPYITYSELVNINEDGYRYERATASITYRDDGQASIDDERWSHPYVSNLLDPGPPVLGPYGNRRADWLSVAANAYALPLIADVQASRQRQCLDRGNEFVNGVLVAHLVLTDPPADRQALKEIWVDRQSREIARVVIAEPLKVFTVQWNLERAITDYSIDIENVDGHDVVQRVTWSYLFHVYDQTSRLEAEYDFTNYRFAAQPPPESLFSSGGR